MSRVERSRREKVTRYSVRKVSFGAASVAVAAFFMFLGNGAVYAAEPNVTATDSALAATPANNQLDENSGSSEATAPKAQADTTTPAPTDASSTSVESSTVSKAQADATTSKPADATPAPVVSSTTSTTEETPEKATPALDKKQLEDYVAEIDAKLASDSYATKTDESVATLKEHLGLAKLALTTAKSQDELTKAYRRLFMTVNSGLRSKPKAQVESPKLDTTEGKATVGKKASNTEKATGTNSIANSGKHDPRNGQALDANNPFRTGDTATTDEDNDSSVNERNLDVVNPYFEANGTPTTAEKWKVINAFDLIGWKLINPNQQKVVIANGKVTQYGGYSSVVNPTHPYSIPLALYKTANDRTSKSDKFDGVYQDIDVTPGQEVVITQNTNSFGPIGTRDNRTILTVSYPERGNDVQGKIVWRSLGTPYNGVVTVPKGVTKLRVRLEVDPDSNVAHTNNGKIEIDGETYYLGAMVSNLSITTGAHVVSNTPTVKYNEVSPSATATTVRATISVEMENKGHASSGSNKYQVKLPEGATFVSSEGGTAPGSVNDGTLTINYKGLKPGEKVTLSYVVDLPADKPTSSDFKGTNTFLTSTTYGGLSGTIQGGSSFAVVGAKLRNIPVTTQNVTVSMYKTDLENKVNELETQLAQLNQADYTPESWKAMQDQLAEAKDILNEEKNNVPVADRKNQSEINAKLVLLEKEKAKLDLEKAAKDQIAAIEAVDGSVKEEKEAAKAKVIEALAAAKKAVDSATTEADVAAKLTEETNKITPILPAEEVKTAAKNDIQSVLEEKKTQIAARDDLTTEEKEAAVKEAERLAQDAKNRVDAATTEESVERNKDRGEEKVEKVDPAAKAKPAAKAAIDAALKAQEQAIDAKPDSTKEEKEAAKEEARAKAEEAKKAIDAATSNADVTAAKEAGVGTITPVEPKAEVKPAAKQAIEDAYTAKVAEIEKRPDLTTEEKEAAKAEARKLADAAKANVDKAKTDAGVAVVEQQGTTNVADVDPVAKAKPAAKAAIDAALKAQEQAIDAKPDSTKEEKEAAKEEARAKAETAKEAIDKATSNADVTAAKEAGVGTITPVEPKAEVKPAAKQAIEDAYTAKVAEIEKRPELTTEEKEAAKAEARKLADAAKANVDKAKTDDAVAAAEDKGTTKVADVDPAAKAKPAAKAAVDAALAEKDKAIDANDKLSDAEKSAAKEEAKKAADEAKKAIDAATDQAGVDAKEAEGKAEIAKVTPAAAVEVGKSAAKAEIEKAAKDKEAAIDANDKLSDAAKAAAKAQVAAEAKKAIEAIEKATTEADVEAAKEAGKAEIAKVAPATTDYKAKAKAEVEAELAKKLAELENATDLTDAEKAAAKAQVVNKAKEAIEAIQKAATEADVDQAIRNFVYRISAVIREQEEYDLSKLFVNGSVTVKQGESLTDKDVLSRLNLPSGVEIVKVEKPTTSALGTVMAKVTVKLADGSVEEINVPVEVVAPQNHGNEGNGANNGANNTEAKVNKAKLEGAIHQLDELIIKESAKLDAETAKEANALSADAKKVFANVDATQAEVDAMVKRIEDFMAKVAPSTDHANTANDQSAQTPAVVPANNQSAQTTVVAPATTQAAANASQTVSAQANARKAAKELPNTGTVDSTVAMVAAAASALLGLGLAGRRRKEDEEA